VKKSLCHAYSQKLGESSMMHNFRPYQGFAVWLLLMLVSSSGCTLKATLDTTTDGTTEFLSSTSGKSWWTEDGLVKSGEHARAFVAINYDNLLQEMAEGQGEYLTAFGTILGVPSHQQAPFQHLVQAQYPALVEISVSQGEEELNRFIGHVQQAWILSTLKNL
jgi:hypothetical protein